jgi:hypothetical protein
MAISLGQPQVQQAVASRVSHEPAVALDPVISGAGSSSSSSKELFAASEKFARTLEVLEVRYAMHV